MGGKIKLLTEDNILLADVQTQKQAISKIGNKMVENEYILTEYIIRTINRESEFPTGLQFNQIGIALCHSTPLNNIKISSIGILKSSTPIIFNSMAGTGQVNANLVFLLALKDGEEHMAILSKLMKIFQDDEFVKSLKTVKSARDLYEKLSMKFYGVEK